MSRRLSLVSFDAVRTLIKPGDGGVGAQYAAAAEKLAGWRLDPDALQISFLEQFKRQRKSFPNYGFDRGMTERQWWTEVVANTFRFASSSSRDSNSSNDRDVSDDDDEAILGRLASHLFDNFEWELYPHASRLLRHLKERRGLKLCVVSNSDDRLEAALRTLGIAEYFDLILTSRGAGVEKPEAEIFRRVLRHFGGDDDDALRPEEALHVGDDAVCDFDAARRLGMKALLVDHRRRTMKDDHVCYDLIELKDKIEEMI